MASLRFAVVVAVLAGVAAAAPPTNTTESTQITLEEKRRLADEACKHIDKQDTTCHEFCLLKNLGAVDDAGRYKEGGAADVLAIGLPKEERDEAVIKQAAKTCNSVNDHIVEGCDRALQVRECLMTEQDKITNRDRRAAKAAAANKNCTNEHDACHKFCVLTSFGVMKHEGGVDERNAIDFVAVTYPALGYYQLWNIATVCAFHGNQGTEHTDMNVTKRTYVYN